MERVLISEFKAKCIELIKRVQATRRHPPGQTGGKGGSVRGKWRNRRQTRLTDRECDFQGEHCLRSRCYHTCYPARFTVILLIGYW